MGKDKESAVVGMGPMQLVMISRPGWWLVNIWLYMAPTGCHPEVFSTLTFWLGLAYVIFPLNLIVYGINDYSDVAIDVKNPRKGNYYYGGKFSDAQMKELPKLILLWNVVPIFLLAVLTGLWWQLFLWLFLCFVVNCAYNVEPVRLSSNGPWELPCVVSGFACVAVLSSMVNDLPWCSFRYWVHMSLLVLRTQVWTEFMDFDEDSAVNRRTTSTLIGRTASQVAVVGLLATEAIATFWFFPDWLMRAFSVLGLVMFVALEVVKGTNDAEKKKAMKGQTAGGFCLMLWVWHKGYFTGGM